jgi:hypothetical protein
MGMMIHKKLRPEKHRCDPWICLDICNPCVNCYTLEKHTWWIKTQVYGNCKVQIEPAGTTKSTEACIIWRSTKKSM